MGWGAASSPGTPQPTLKEQVTCGAKPSQGCTLFGAYWLEGANRSVGPGSAPHAAHHECRDQQAGQDKG